MAKPPANKALQVNNSFDFTGANGYVQNPNISSLQQAPYPIANPVQLIGVDAVTKTFQAGTTTITFPNLPTRNNNGNPLTGLKTTGNVLTIQPQDLLIIFAFSQGASAPIAVSSQALSNQLNKPIPGPFLGGNNYLTFQAEVVTSTEINATIVGMLFLQRG